MNPAPATLPSRYQLGEVIGVGGTGRVYRARDATLDRDVAIKLLDKALPGKDNTQQRERFVREARAAARLVHPNIVAVHDVDPDAGWLVMALIDGKTLRELPLPSPPALVRVIARQVLAALVAAHEAGVVHRDIKPSNIVLDDRQHVTLVDFGVARLLDGELTKTGEALGTPAYMAPEQMRGAVVDARRRRGCGREGVRALARRPSRMGRLRASRRVPPLSRQARPLYTTLLWSGDPVRWKLVTAWSGSPLEHPAVALARRLTE